MPWKILHMGNFSRLTIVSVKVNFMFVNSKNNMGERNMAQSILQTQSVFLWTYNQGGVILGV